MMNNLQTYLNNSQYVNLPIRRSSDYQSNTSEQNNSTGFSREELLEQLGILSLIEETNKSIETKLDEPWNRYDIFSTFSKFKFDKFTDLNKGEKL